MFSRGRVLQGFLVLDVESVQSHVTLRAAPWIQPFCAPMRLLLMADQSGKRGRRRKESCCVGRSQELHLGVRFLKIDSAFNCSIFYCTRESYTSLWGACWSAKVEIAWEKPRGTGGVILLGGWSLNSSVSHRSLNLAKEGRKSRNSSFWQLSFWNICWTEWAESSHPSMSDL